MGIYNTIVFAEPIPCPDCGTPMTGWQTKHSYWRGYSIDPAFESIPFLHDLDAVACCDCIPCARKNKKMNLLYIIIDHGEWRFATEKEADDWRPKWMT